MMDPHVRNLDDALADVARALAASAGNPITANRPPRTQDGGGRKPLGRAITSTRATINRDPSGQAPRPVSPVRAPDRFVAPSVPTGYRTQALWLVIAISVGVAGFRLVDEARQRNRPDQPTLTRLLFAPGISSEKGL